MVIYLAAYNPCVYESHPKILSAHTTQGKAEKACDRHKAKRKKRGEVVDQLSEKYEVLPFPVQS